MTPDDMKREAARAALAHVESGMRLGLGHGSTAKHFVDLLGEKVRSGLDVICVPASEFTHDQAKGLGIPLTTLDETPELDLAVDGADEIGPALGLIKGGGGALLREKIVAAAAASMLVIADESKVVPMLGRFPLPVEVIPFGFGATRAAVERIAAKLGLSGELRLRHQPDGLVFVTDGGHHILDCHFQQIPDPAALAAGLSTIPGVVEHGLFLGYAKGAYVAGSSGVRFIGPA
ncbi:ribose-5-phosphate isomerase RpiA [Labrys sp. ZIDIC5]|uniref:ribose-5-phosphate isomerase RpiA n=1 Tax=Labrys sedimenti TaxID=3106036 RepID=UPI002ACA9A13|nr:ribose-5-phosphate isomerase RpiA [Labrys sp. ZIDIC5]MDZ5450120.1 ribose-5-phosphate isomerase RpiA [Labrys sp. ZIDIC5]